MLPSLSSLREGSGTSWHYDHGFASHIFSSCYWEHLGALELEKFKLCFHCSLSWLPYSYLGESASALLNMHINFNFTFLSPHPMPCYSQTELTTTRPNTLLSNEDVSVPVTFQTCSHSPQNPQEEDYSRRKNQWPQPNHWFTVISYQFSFLPLVYFKSLLG